VSRPMESTRPWLRPGLAVVLCLAVAGAAVRRALVVAASAAVVAFLTLGPGLGIVGLLGVRDRWQQLALVIGLSLAIDVLAVAAFQYAGDEDAGHPLAVLIVLALVGAVADLCLGGAMQSRRETAP
jgi:hypothetical protein